LTKDANMGCECKSPQATAYAEAMKLLAIHQPDQYEWLESLGSDELLALVARHAAEQVHQEGGEPFFKPRPPNQNIACYLTADFNYAQSHQACSLITDPKLRAECQSKARDAYCEAIELCGGSSK